MGLHPLPQSCRVKSKCHTHDSAALFTVLFIRCPFVRNKTVGLSSRAITIKKTAIKSMDLAPSITVYSKHISQTPSDIGGNSKRTHSLFSPASPQTCLSKVESERGKGDERGRRGTRLPLKGMSAGFGLRADQLEPPSPSLL